MEERDNEERAGCAGARRELGGWGPCRGPMEERDNEERAGCAGARRELGGLGAMTGPPWRSGITRSGPAAPGRDESWGGLGAMTRPPMEERDNEERAGCAGARRE